MTQRCFSDFGIYFFNLPWQFINLLNSYRENIYCSVLWNPDSAHFWLNIVPETKSLKKLQRLENIVIPWFNKNILHLLRFKFYYLKHWSQLYSIQYTFRLIIKTENVTKVHSAGPKNLLNLFHSSSVPIAKKILNRQL